MAKIDREKIHNILVVRTDRIGKTGQAARYYGLGEALLNTVAIRALKETFQACCVVLVNPAARELLMGSPEIDEIIVFDEDKWNRSIRARLSLLWQIRRRKFDLAVIFNPTKRFHLLTYLAGIKNEAQDQQPRKETDQYGLKPRAFIGFCVDGHFLLFQKPDQIRILERRHDRLELFKFCGLPILLRFRAQGLLHGFLELAGDFLALDRNLGNLSLTDPLLKFRVGNFQKPAGREGIEKRKYQKP